MANKIELCFRTGPSPPHEGTSDNDHQQDTFGSAAEQDSSKFESRRNNEETLEELYIGQRTVGEVVREVGRFLGHELFPSQILQPNMETTKIFLEHVQPNTINTDTRESDTLFDITDGGVVHSSMASSCKEASCDNQSFVQLRPIFTKAPSVLFGLNYLDYAKDGFGNIQIAGVVEEIHDDLFYLHTRRLDRRDLDGVGYTWLAVPSYQNPLLQVGTFTNVEDKSYRKGLSYKVITFEYPYVQPPNVVVWLNSFDSNNLVRLHVTLVTSTSFRVDFHTRFNEVYDHREGFSWFAYPVNTPGISSGYVDASAGGIIRFHKAFSKPPRRILLGLTGLNGYTFYGWRVRISHEAVTTKGMGVKIQSWGQNLPDDYVGLAYIAME